MIGDYFKRIFDTPIGIAIFGLVMAFISDWYCENVLKMGDGETKAITLSLILFYIGTLLWGRVIINRYKNKMLSWFVFGPIMLLFVSLQAVSIIKRLLPVPPTGGTIIDQVYAVLFGGIAIYTSVRIMNMIEPRT